MRRRAHFVLDGVTAFGILEPWNDIRAGCWAGQDGYVRLFVVIPHYFGPGDPANSSQVIGAYVEPLGRIAALSETIACLHRNFGPNRNTLSGDEVASPEGPNTIDIVIVTMRDRNILAEIGVDPSIYTVEYVDGPPTQIPFHAQRLMKERLGRYDFYCLMEDDLAIHDPEFFAKLRWFQDCFGVTVLLAPTRVETAYAGTPAKIVIDPLLTPAQSAPFRRAGQRERLVATWHGTEWDFELPSNVHAACFFLSGEQLAYWVRQPSFDDKDASWIAPVESAVSLGIGKVFDIYKSARPDPFFLEVHHYGTFYAGRNAPHGRRYGEPPLLAIAQGAARKAGETHNAGRDAIRAWLAAGTAGEAVSELVRQSVEWAHLRRQVSDLDAQAQRREAEIAALKAELVSVWGELASARTGLSLAQVGVAQAEAESAQARAESARAGGELAQAQAELARAGAELAQAVGELAQAQAELAQAGRELAQAQVSLAQERAELACVRSDLVGHMGALYAHRHSFRTIIGTGLSELRRRLRGRLAGSIRPQGSDRWRR
jgi:hypothetical protein